MILDIKIYPDKILTRKTKPVIDFGAATEELINNMVETIYANRGAGLAANQVGVGKQVVVISAGDGLKALINPKIVGQSGRAVMTEGCLSFPGLELEIKRPVKIEVAYFDKNGRPRTITAVDLTARIICHEIDHLNGRTMLDHLSFWKRLMVAREWKKQRRDNGSDPSA